MSKQLRERHITQPPQNKAHSGIGNPKVGTAFCMNCRNRYERKSWKHPRETTPGLRDTPQNSRPFHFVVCPACAMINAHLYEGMILIEHVPAHHADELRGLIHGFGKRAELRDPQHRLIGIEEKGSTLVVTTTENQLAAKLARKIVQAFKHQVAIANTFSREPYKKEFLRLTFRTDS